MRAPKFVKDNGLSLLLGGLFVGALCGQAFAGAAAYNGDRIAQGLAPISLSRYLTSSTFAVDVTENWQSEYLQFLVFILALVWLTQVGSAEAKEPEDLGAESDREQKTGRYAEPDSPQWATGGWRTAIYGRSLGIVTGTIWLFCWLVQSAAGWAAFNEQRLADLERPVSWGSYLLSSDFWNRTLQNWQSEFLAVGSVLVFSIYLRQRGSSESKPVGAAHETTGVSG